MPNKKKSHNFREFFVLVKSDTNKSNAKVVCICCMQKVGGLAIAQVTSGCFTSNKVRLCWNHFANCENFKLTYTKVVKKNLSHPVPGDLKNNGKDFLSSKILKFFDLIIISNPFLESLFIDELESPTFLGSDVIFTGAC